MVSKQRHSTLCLPIRVALVFWCLALAFPVLTQAQSGQYVAPGSLAVSRVSTAESVKSGAEDAKWRWGALRLQPRLSLNNLGYDENVFASAEGEQQTSDFRAAVGAGLTAYSKLGSKVYFSAYAAPEYSWWQDLDDLRELNVSYGAGAFGYFNRLQFGVQAVSTERERLLANEAEIPVQTLDEKIFVDVRVELRPRLAVEGRGTINRYRYDDQTGAQRPDLRIGELESDTDRLEALMALTLRNGLEIGLGLEDQASDFLIDPGGRSNRSASPLVRLAFEGTRLRLDTRLIAQETEFDGPEIPSFETTTGSALATYRFGEETEGSAYVARNLVFGVTGNQSTIEDDRWGLSIARQLGARIDMRLFSEAGRFDYRDPGGLNAGRRDDLAALGAGLTFELSSSTSVTFQFSELTYDSNLPEFDRSTTRFGIGVELGQGLLPW